jgi:SpoVK/Ycf46/Vps4 family AAA+-type ATPase
MYDDQNDLKIYLNLLNVALLRNHIRRMYKIQEYMKLWKVNVHNVDIEKISTEDDIVELGGIEMDPLKLVEKYFENELNDQNFMKENMRNIHIIAIYDIAGNGKCLSMFYFSNKKLTVCLFNFFIVIK